MWKLVDESDEDDELANIEVGDFVEIIKPRRKGTVMFIGKTHFGEPNKVWYGLELSRPHSKSRTSGTIGGVTYFQTSRPKTGVFVGLSKIAKVVRKKNAVRLTKREKKRARQWSKDFAIWRQQRDIAKQKPSRSRSNMVKKSKLKNFSFGAKSVETPYTNKPIEIKKLKSLPTWHRYKIHSNSDSGVSDDDERKESSVEITRGSDSSLVDDDEDTQEKSRELNAISPLSRVAAEQTSSPDVFVFEVIPPISEKKKKKRLRGRENLRVDVSSSSPRRQRISRRQKNDAHMIEENTVYEDTLPSVPLRQVVRIGDLSPTVSFSSDNKKEGSPKSSTMDSLQIKPEHLRLISKRRRSTITRKIEEDPMMMCISQNVKQNLDNRAALLKLIVDLQRCVNLVEYHLPKVTAQVDKSSAEKIYASNVIQELLKRVQREQKSTKIRKDFRGIKDVPLTPKSSYTSEDVEAMVNVMAWMRNNIQVSALVDENDAKMSSMGAAEVIQSLLDILLEATDEKEREHLRKLALKKGFSTSNLRSPRAPKKRDGVKQWLAEDSLSNQEYSKSAISISGEATPKFQICRNV